MIDFIPIPFQTFTFKNSIKVPFLQICEKRETFYNENLIIFSILGNTIFFISFLENSDKKNFPKKLPEIGQRLENGRLGF